MVDSPPVGTSVFTTLRWDGGGRVAWLALHLARMREHAQRLRIEWPDDLQNRLASLVPDAPDDGGNVCRIHLTREGDLSATVHQMSHADSPLCAISRAAPRWSKRVQGTKHADWSPYRDARSAALDAGADLALLVHEGAVVDGDRCTPILLDVDGVAYASPTEDGGVDSITLALLGPEIEAAGIPFRRAHLTETLIGRARELIVVGTGLGAAWIDEVDGQRIGTGAAGPLFAACNEGFETLLAAAWTTLGGES